MPEPNSQLVLASASPRRSEIMRTLGLEFEIAPSDASEALHDGEAPAEYVVRVARAKVADVAPRYPRATLIGADTIVVVDGRPLGKPSGADEASSMLRLLSGRWHAVMTGIAVRDAASGVEHAGHEKTLVRLRDLTESEIAAYVATKEPFDKAGGYAIQGRAMLFVDEIAGNYHNVVGLPPTLLARLLSRLGVSV